MVCNFGFDLYRLLHTICLFVAIDFIHNARVWIIDKVGKSFSVRCNLMTQFLSVVRSYSFTTNANIVAHGNS